MRVCVFGLWHLGCVTAACLADAGHQVVALDPDPERVAQLRLGKPPLFEPGLAELIAKGVAAGRLRFETNPAVVSDADVLWVTFDTPVDENDVAQPAIVVDHVQTLFANFPNGLLVLISSQLPAGTTRRLADMAARSGCRNVMFAYSPENLRLGRAIEVFTNPDRIIVGVEEEAARNKIAVSFGNIANRIEWMGIESAEMTKHAINAFLATSVCFMNEVAAICEHVGANAKDVERGLKTEKRIGPHAYLTPGGPFAGGTLARDVTTLNDLGARSGVSTVLIAAVQESNSRHSSWPMNKLKERLGSLKGKQIAILGLTYKAGTSTLRRSSAIELAQELRAAGAKVVGFDPAVSELPADLGDSLYLAHSAAEALANADAAVIATAWPEFRKLEWPALVSTMRQPIIVDAGWFLAEILRSQRSVAYTCVGLPWTTDV